MPGVACLSVLGLMLCAAATLLTPRSLLPGHPPLQAINVAAGGSGAELTPQDIALAATQQARLHPQPPTLAELHALARRVNAQPLTGPSDKQHGIKLPPGGVVGGGRRAVTGHAFAAAFAAAAAAPAASCCWPWCCTQLGLPANQTSTLLLGCC